MDIFMFDMYLTCICINIYGYVLCVYSEIKEHILESLKAASGYG